MTSPARPLLLAAFALLLGAATPSEPERNAPPPTSPKPVMPSTEVLFADDFSDRTLARWTTDRPDVWTARRGVLRGDLPDGKQQHSFLRAGSATWTDYAVDLDVCQMRGVDKGVAVRVVENKAIAVDLRGPGYQDVLLHRDEWPIGRAKVVNGNGIWHHVRVEARGPRFRVFVNGERVLERENGRASHARGGIALPAYTGGGGKCTVYYDNVVVSALK